MNVPRPDRPLSLEEGRTIYNAVGGLAEETRLLRGAIAELTAVMRMAIVSPLPGMRGELPSAEDIAVAVHRGTDSDRARAAIKRVGIDAFVHGAIGFAKWVAPPLVAYLLTHFFKL
jgi:hypothetical protein